MRVGVIGATGYVGGRLVPAGYQVRCLARTPSRLDRVEVEAADVFDEPSLEEGVFRTLTLFTTWCNPWAMPGTSSCLSRDRTVLCRLAGVDEVHRCEDAQAARFRHGSRAEFQGLRHPDRAPRGDAESLHHPERVVG